MVKRKKLIIFLVIYRDECTNVGVYGKSFQKMFLLFKSKIC